MLILLSRFVFAELERVSRSFCCDGSLTKKYHPSRPYMFRPDANKTAKNAQNIPRVRGDKPATLTITHTAAGTEVRQEFAPWLTQVI